jgi:hypothetical protein
MARTRVHGKRAMLNPPGFHSTAAIVAEIADTRDRKPGCDAMGEPVTLDDDIYKAEPEYVMLQISDCDRRINLAIGFRTAGDRRDALYKVDKIIDVLSEFRKGLVIEQERYVRRVEHAIAESRKS